MSISSNCFQNSIQIHFLHNFCAVAVVVQLPRKKSITISFSLEVIFNTLFNKDSAFSVLNQVVEE